jgi:hypothetical protein
MKQAHMHAESMFLSAYLEHHAYLSRRFQETSNSSFILLGNITTQPRLRTAVGTVFTPHMASKTVARRRQHTRASIPCSYNPVCTNNGDFHHCMILRFDLGEKSLMCLPSGAHSTRPFCASNIADNYLTEMAYIIFHYQWRYTIRIPLISHDFFLFSRRI